MYPREVDVPWSHVIVLIGRLYDTLNVLCSVIWFTRQDEQEIPPLIGSQSTDEYSNIFV